LAKPHPASTDIASIKGGINGVFMALGRALHGPLRSVLDMRPVLVSANQAFVEHDPGVLENAWVICVLLIHNPNARLPLCERQSSAI